MKTVDRRKFLGGSDAAAVLGVSPWKTPVQLWLEKTGRDAELEREDPDATRRKKRGVILEPFIRQMTIEKLVDEGHDVKLVATNKRYTDRVDRFLSCEIDFELMLDGELVPVDAKSVDGRARLRWGEVGTDEIPIEYAAQFMAGLMIHPKAPRRTLVAALRGFDDVDLYWQERDEVTIEAMRAKMVSFWLENVKADKPPDPKTLADLRGLWPKPEPKGIQATDEILELVAGLKKIQADAADLKRAEDNIRFFLGRFIGDAAVLRDGVRDLMTWELEERGRFDLDAFKAAHPDWHAMFYRREKTRVLRFARSRAGRQR